MVFSGAELGGGAGLFCGIPARDDDDSMLSRKPCAPGKESA